VYSGWGQSWYAEQEYSIAWYKVYKVYKKKAFSQDV
jgi:hypothetical protein